MNILVNGVPLDVVSVLDARAKRHFRSRTGEILAILTAACCGSDVLGKPAIAATASCADAERVARGNGDGKEG